MLAAGPRDKLDLLHDVEPPLHKAAFSPRLEGWLSQLLSPASSVLSLQPYVTFLRGCNTVLSLVKDTGYEVALHVLGLECTKASKAAQQQVQAGYVNMADGTAQTAAASVEALLQALTAQVCHLHLVLEALPTSLGQSMPAFPKFQKLVQFLVELKASKAAFHGMVFVKERQGVFELVKMLQSAPDLAGVNLYPFTGEGKSQAKSATRTPLQSSSSGFIPKAGMKHREAKAAFRTFLHATGQEVLVATAAAEEGIDVPSCEFVVCYTVVGSGRERTQRQGRARAKMAKFVEFVEVGSSDVDLQHKACQEQTCSRLAQQLHLKRCG